MIPDVLHIGPVPIHLFGIFLALGFLVASEVFARELKRKGYDAAHASSVILWAAAGGLVGARLWLVLEGWSEFVRDPASFLLTGGGFVWYGGLLGGALAVTAYFRRHAIAWLKGADAAAPALAIGQAIGRIGCQLAGDGDWGAETTLPWGMAYPHAVVGWDKPPGVHVHPAPLYECALYLAVFLFLWRTRKQPAPDGTAISWYCVLAAGARFLIEFVRINPRVALGLSLAQLVSLALVVAGSGWLLYRRRAWRPAAA
jgi:phosphatidylglycerol:prolipoprotein diacylglycerol transferase